jgi:malate dehydrogenase (quinone)
MYEVAIVGGGVTGTALAYVLSNFCEVKSIALIERRTGVAQVNSNVVNNSQTLHSGEIETNFSLEKALRVKDAAALLSGFLERSAPHAFMPVQKMVIGVGEAETEFLRQRYEQFRPHFPHMRLLSRPEIASAEPNVVACRPETEALNGLYTGHGHAVDYQLLSQSFVLETKRAGVPVDFIFHLGVKAIDRGMEGFVIRMDDGSEIAARAVVVCAGPSSLLFAHALGVGRQYGILPVAGSFYRGRDVLNGKVYTVQNPKIPFAAVHGDPAVYDRRETRFGPTAKMLPLLERHHYATFMEFMRTPTLGWAGLRTLLSILRDRDIGRFALRNVLYEIPFFGKRAFLKSARKVVPGLSAGDLTLDRGAGGIRGQLIDVEKRQMVPIDMLQGENILFNMAPSPGASASLKKAEEDAERVVGFLGRPKGFDRERFRRLHLGTEAAEAHLRPA